MDTRGKGSSEYVKGFVRLVKIKLHENKSFTVHLLSQLIHFEIALSMKYMSICKVMFGTYSICRLLKAFLKKNPYK